jgi:hypothetical protein
MPTDTEVIDACIRAACIRAAAGWYGAGPSAVEYTIADARRLYALATRVPWIRGDTP